MKRKIILGRSIVFLFIVSFILIKDINVSAAEQLTSIMGQATATKGQMIRYLLDNNSNKNYEDANYFVQTVIDEANIEGVKADIAFAQMMKETNFLKFTGVVKPEQNNFGGIGATGGDNAGASFSSIQIGIRANIQHLKAYASTEDLRQACVDPRFKYVTKGSAEFVEWLGIQENPSRLGWAADKNYGYDIVNRNIYISKLSNLGKATNPSFNINGTKFEINRQYTINGSATSTNGTLYQYWIRDLDKDNWTIIKDWSSDPTLNWKPSRIGQYRIELHVKDKYSDLGYDSGYYKDLNVEKYSGVAVNAYFNTGKESLLANEEITFTASGKADSAIMYQYWIRDLDKDNWSVIQDWSSNNVFKWISSRSGNFRIELHIKDINSSKEFDSAYFKDIKIDTFKATNAQFIVKDEPIYINKNYSFTGSAASKNPVFYQYWIRDIDKNNWSVLKDWSSDSVLNWTPSRAGGYRIELHVKDKLSTNDFDSNFFYDFNVKDSAKASKATFTIVNDKVFIGKDNTIIGSGSSLNTVLYQYWIRDINKDIWSVLKDWSSDSTLAWKPDKLGTYRLEMHIKDEKSRNEYDDYYYKDIVTNKPSGVSSNAGYSLNADDLIVSNKINIVGNANSTNITLYQYWIRDLNKNNWSVLKDWSQDGKLVWTPSKSGTYRLELHTKDIYSSNDFDSSFFRDITVKDVIASDAKFELATYDIVANKSYKISSSGKSLNPILYQYWIRDLGKDNWSIINDWNSNNEFLWSPQVPGDYRIELHIKDSKSTKEFDSVYYKDIRVDDANGVAKNAYFSLPKNLIRPNTSVEVLGSGLSSNSILYQYWIRDLDKDNWIVLKDWSSDPKIIWTPDRKGEYRLELHIKDKRSNKEFDSAYYKDIYVSNYFVVLDVGHGGTDSGAIGYNGAKEKDVVLQIAKKAKAMLESIGITVISTRDNDVYVSLEDRTKLINDLNPDIAISIHANSADPKSANGVEVYHSIKSSQATSGKKLAELLAQYTSDQTGVQNRGAKTRESTENPNTDYYHMIRESNAPSVILETGFLSNESDCNKLIDSNYQNKFANAILLAVKNFFNI